MSHTAELIAVGTELLLGNIANTDAQMLSQGLSALGINVYYHTVVGDNPQRLRAAVELAKSRADILITTGGLGPTCDDLTKNVLAECFGKKLVFHAPSARRIEAYFERLHAGRPMTENNYQQAMLPEGCTVLDNDWGTAPGVAFEADGVRVIMLPGPPRECRAMFTHRVIPYLKSLADGVIVSRTLKLFGIGESSMEAQLREEMEAMTNPTLAPYAKEGECELRVTAKAPTDQEAQALTQSVERSDRKLRAMNLAAGKPISRRELERKLAGWGAGEEEQEAVCSRLEELGYLNDAAYAAQVARHYWGRGYGQRKIQDELYRRGIPRELWDQALEQCQDPAEAIDAFLAKKLGGGPVDRKELQKVSAALARRGYQWSDISDALRRYGAEVEED